MRIGRLEQVETANQGNRKSKFVEIIIKDQLNLKPSHTLARQGLYQGLINLAEWIMSLEIFYFLILKR